MSEAICEICNYNPPLTCLICCAACLYQDKINAECELEALKTENAALRSELSAYKEGIPVEDADKGKDFLAHEYEDYFVVCAHHGDDKGWRYYNDRSDMFEKVNSDRLYPLPEEKEERS